MLRIAIQLILFGALSITFAYSTDRLNRKVENDDISWAEATLNPFYDCLYCGSSKISNSVDYVDDKQKEIKAAAEICCKSVKDSLYESYRSCPANTLNCLMCCGTYQRCCESCLENVDPILNELIRTNRMPLCCCGIVAEVGATVACNEENYLLGACCAFVGCASVCTLASCCMCAQLLKQRKLAKNH